MARYPSYKRAMAMSISLIVGCFDNIVYPTPSFAQHSNPQAEQWILEQVASGKMAGLEKKFPNAGDRVISSSFLDRLITGSLKGIEVGRYGVRIANAILTEPLDLENAEFPYETWLIGCDFKNNVNFSKGTFKKDVVFDGSSFLTANFSGIKVDGSISFSKVKFSPLSSMVVT